MMTAECRSAVLDSFLPTHSAEESFIQGLRLVSRDILAVKVWCSCLLIGKHCQKCLSCQDQLANLIYFLWLAEKFVPISFQRPRDFQAENLRIPQMKQKRLANRTHVKQPVQVCRHNSRLLNAWRFPGNLENELKWTAPRGVSQGDSKICSAAEDPTLAPTEIAKSYNLDRSRRHCRWVIQFRLSSWAEWRLFMHKKSV